ncbi:hypothetical protein PoB_002773500 [Plakobranchus ocellatus]|uniref:G-protein coupled receptors family 1 profile domain-containing protein n=1 Tax=Plakobranchus ocellatus TaxID=259542 RepID=A0AAV4A2S3_9GAST|nr:hypothetical protein PoB_002773500 [Plakobranchus ocellatus]
MKPRIGEMKAASYPQQWPPWLVTLATFGVLPIAIVTVCVSGAVIAIRSGKNKNLIAFFTVQMALCDLLMACGPMVIFFVLVTGRIDIQPSGIHCQVFASFNIRNNAGDEIMRTSGPNIAFLSLIKFDTQELFRDGLTLTTSSITKQDSCLLLRPDMSQNRVPVTMFSCCVV